MRSGRDLAPLNSKGALWLAASASAGSWSGNTDAHAHPRPARLNKFPRGFVCTLVVEKHCFRDDSICVLRWEHGIPEWQRDAPKVIHLVQETRASEPGSGAFFHPHDVRHRAGHRCRFNKCVSSFSSCCSIVAFLTRGNSFRDQSALPGGLQFSLRISPARDSVLSLSSFGTR